MPSLVDASSARLPECAQQLRQPAVDRKIHIGNPDRADDARLGLPGNVLGVLNLSHCRLDLVQESPEAARA